MRKILLMLLLSLLVMASVPAAMTTASATNHPVCEIVGGIQYETLDEALNAVADGQTIRLLTTIDYNNGISITDGRSIIFDLNGFYLNVVSSGGVGLTVTSGSVGYTGAGEFNVSGASFGLNVNGSNASATVTNATATSSGSYGASSSNGGSITINNDVEGGYAGAYAFGADSTIVVLGDATGNDANSYGAFAQGGTIAIGGDAQGALCGVSANGGSASATVTNATATAEGGNGAVAMNGGDIVVNGNAQGGYNGVSVANPGSTAVVNGNATGTASDSSGARVGSGGNATINGGTALGVSYGAYANGSGSQITINGGDAIGTGPTSGKGVHAEIGGTISVNGNTRGTRYGVYSGGDASVVIAGNAEVTALVNGYGVNANQGTIEIGGNVVANGSSLGAFASIGEITIDGAILATNYIRIFDDVNEMLVYKDGSEGSRTIPTTKAGYHTYSAGTSSIWVSDVSADTTPPVWTAGYPRTFNLQDKDLILVVSADEACTAYYVVLTGGTTPAPTSEQVEDRLGNTVPGGNFDYTNPPNDRNHYVGGLTPETAYDIYLVLKDSAGNLHSAPVCLDVTTLPEADTDPNDANSGITGQVQGAAGSRQVTLTVTVRNEAGEPITGIGPGYFEVSIDGGSALQFVNNPPFSGFTGNGDGAYTVVFTGAVHNTSYTFTNLTVSGVVVESSYSVTTPPSGGRGGGGGSAPVNSASRFIEADTGDSVHFAGATVEVPAGTLPADATLKVERLTEQEAETLVSSGLRVKLGSDVYEITTSGVREFGDNTVTIRIAYEPAKIAAGEQPVIRYRDETTAQWIDLPTTVEQGADGKWYAVTHINHLTKFAVFSSPVPEPVRKVIVLTLGRQAATVDGSPYTLDAVPFVDTGANRTLVPIRFVSEALGAGVGWLANIGQVVIKDGGQEIILTIGSRDVLVNGVKQAIDCAPVVVPPGRAFVPLRFVSETLGATVDYDPATGQITVIR